MICGAARPEHPSGGKDWSDPFAHHHDELATPSSAPSRGSGARLDKLTLELPTASWSIPGYFAILRRIGAEQNPFPPNMPAVLCHHTMGTYRRLVKVSLDAAHSTENERTRADLLRLGEEVCNDE